MSYTWAAYLVALLAVLVWVGIISLKVRRLEREIRERERG